MGQLFEQDVTEPIVGYAQVATEQGIDLAATGLTYAVPESMADLAVGERVIVPLGRGDRRVAGFVIALSERSDVDNVKSILSRDASALTLPPDLIELARWMAGYYCTPLGMVLANILPAAVKRGIGRMQQTFVRPTDMALATAQDKPPKLPKLQRALLDAAIAHWQEHQQPLEIHDLAYQAGARTITPARQLIDKGLLATETHQAVRSADTMAAFERSVAPAPPPALTADQQNALAQIVPHLNRGFSVHLLQGVTGSGKTEVYLRIIEALRASQCANDTTDLSPGIIILVPEIALTPQTVQRFHDRFDQIAVLHSGLTAAQRHDQWRRIQRGEARIVIGARSAIFAPMANLRLIIVDEEHEQSYKQDQLPRYHARDVAVKRGQMLDIPVVLGSATPSLESFHNAVVRGTYHRILLSTRATGAALPRVDIVDMSEERRKRYQMTGSAGVHLFSLRLEGLLQQTLKAGKQAMLLLNRRGYANYIACPDQNCGFLLHCDYCDAAMVYHKDLRLPMGGVVRCHHCSAEQLLPRQCPTCGKRITTFGLGTQRVEEELQRVCPEARYTRMDSDTMQHARDYHETLERFRRGELDVLVGTQMIAKGLDFPNVRLVGVISADTALNLPDFRASERTFQLISQVAGRAGRSADPAEAGIVVVQTFNPNDPAIVLASKHDYETFAMRELELRRNVGLPPVTRMARLVVRDRNLNHCVEHARKLASAITTFNRDLVDNTIRLRGPAPCPIARIAEFHRQQIELIAPDAATLQRLLTALRNARLVKSDAHIAVDVDPVSLL